MVWGWWLLLVLGSFAVMEGYDIATGHWDRTLSAWVRRETKSHIISVYTLGLLTGWAMMHFWGAGWCG